MNTTYAGFWLRFLAWILDTFILSAIQWVIIVPLFAAMGIASSFSFSDFSHLDKTDAAVLFSALMATFGIVWFINVIVKLLYHSFLESSKYQGSFGKLALGLQVTDLNGQKLDFGKAFIRNLCKFVSNVTLSIGYIIAGLTDKKQALHDIIAATLVVKKDGAVAATQPT
jgi:uncharacterized RDD family membrane protein YckC